jgi:hypothetical protein
MKNLTPILTPSIQKSARYQAKRDTVYLLSPVSDNTCPFERPAITSAAFYSIGHRSQTQIETGPTSHIQSYLSTNMRPDVEWCGAGLGGRLKENKFRQTIHHVGSRSAPDAEPDPCNEQKNELLASC